MGGGWAVRVENESQSYNNKMSLPAFQMQHNTNPTTLVKLAWQRIQAKWQAFIVNKCELFYVNIWCTIYV